MKLMIYRCIAVSVMAALCASLAPKEVRAAGESWLLDKNDNWCLKTATRRVCLPSEIRFNRLSDTAYDFDNSGKSTPPTLRGQFILLPNDYYGDTVELPSYAELIKSEQYNNLSIEIVSVDVTNGGDGRMYIAIVQIRGKFGFNVGCGDLNELQEFANMILDQLLRPSS